MMIDRYKNFTGQTKPTNSGQKNLSYRLLSLGSTIGLFGVTLVFIAAIFSTIYNFLFTGKLQGSWLLLVVLPLWICGAYCFDYGEGDFGK